jgi:uncharacterized protein with HEPN domain
MLDAAHEALGFVKDRARADLDRDRMLVMALVKEVEIIGEAAYQLTAEFTSHHSQIPWADIIGMRHRLVHAYFDINLDILWQTTQQDLAPLAVELEKLVSADDGEIA